MKTLTLALPKSKLQPPPTKSEVIDALTKLRVEKNIAERAKQVAERIVLKKELDTEIEQLATDGAIAFAKSAHLGRYYRDDKFVDGIYVAVIISHKQLSKETHDKLKKFHRLPEREITAHSDYVKMIRKEVQEQVNGIIPRNERVLALLNDETSKAALEKMLEAIS